MLLVLLGNNVVTLLGLDLGLYSNGKVMLPHLSITLPIQLVNEVVREAIKACYFKETFD